MVEKLKMIMALVFIAQKVWNVKKEKCEMYEKMIFLIF